MLAGFDRADVTPPLGMPMQGLGQKEGCASIHDPLFVRALALEEGETRALVLGCDLLFFDRPDIDRQKERIARACGIAPEAIFHNCSHNHAGPRLTDWNYLGGGDPAYLDLVAERMAAVAHKAFASLRPVTIEAGMAATSLPISRRNRSENGRVSWAPFPEGTICPHVPITLFRTQDGSVLSILFSVACHPSTLYDCVISADYPGVAQAELNAAFDTEGAFFLQGCGGDTKPRQIADGDFLFRSDMGFEPVEAAGHEVAEVVAARIRAGLTPVKPALKNVLTEVRWPLTKPKPRWHYVRIAGDETSPRRAAWARDMLAQLEAGRDWSAVPVRLHGLRIGEGLRLVGLEGEPVAELGNRIHAAFPDGVTFALGYTDGAQLYLPVSPMLQEGGYEVDSAWEYHWPSELARGGDDLILEAVHTMHRDGL